MCAVLCIIFIVCFLYILPRSLPPKIIDVTNESHNITEADPTDIKIIVETNLTVETIYFDDNEVRKAWTNDYERKGMKHIFSTVLVFDEEDNSDHTITVSIRASNGSERVQETSFKYNPGDYRESKTVSVTLSPTSTLTPTPTPTIEGSDGELEIVCIPAKNLGTEEELHEFYNHIDSASSAALVRLYSEIMSPELDACFVLTTEKELTGIVLNAVSETTIYPPCYMKKINEGVWYFDADFIENSMFEIAVTAYAKDGMVYREKIHLKFPFE